MAKYPLASLLSAREFREDAAARESAAARRKADAAKAAEEEAEATWHAYQEWRPGEEVRLFEEIRGKVMPLTGLDGHRDDIQALRSRELHLEEVFHEAEEATAAAEKAAAEAKERHSETVRDRRKIEEHRNVWLQAEAKRQEAAEEAELEEFTTRSSESNSEEADDE